ncbi:MAG: TIM-barrel domain-containing protein [Crocinitomicaceae bacterium]
MNKFTLFFLFIFGIVSVFSQERFLSSEITNQGINVTTSAGLYEIRQYNSTILETSYFPNGTEKSDPTSHAVVLSRKGNSFVPQGNATFVSGNLEVKLAETGPFSISYFYKNKQIIRQTAAQNQSIHFIVQHDEILYGGGARALGMNRRGNRLRLYNRAHYGYEEHSELMNFTMPLFISSKGYAVHFDNPFTGYLDLDSKKNNQISYEPEGGPLRYQVVFGENLQEVTENYVQLTGLQPVPPLWAFGNFSSRFGYHSQQEVLSTIHQFKKDSIPVDAIILDLYWFGKEIQGTMGNLSFYTDSFPEPKKMIDSLRKMKVETVLITEPFILSTSSRWDEAIDTKILATDSVGNPYRYDFYFGNTGLIDITQNAGKNWFWNIYNQHYDLGVTGFWGDLGEPEVHPDDLFHGTKKANEIHNVYGHLWAKMVAEGFQKKAPNFRPFILMRAGYSGSQHYGMIPWSGDVNRTWGGLKPQAEIALQMGMQGMAYMHSDLGGFAGDNDDPKLYQRWLQYGVFQPVFRPHAQEQVASEPVFKDDLTKAIAKKAIELRYELLPYNFSLAVANSKKGTPLMRPLFYEEPENNALYQDAKTYLWGTDFLVHPITDSLNSIDMYFPKTANWYDWYSGEKVVGGTTKTIQTNPWNIPTYVRGGAIVPTTPGIQNTKEYLKAGITLHHFYEPTILEKSEKVFFDGENMKLDENDLKSIYIQFEGSASKLDYQIDSQIEEITNIHWEIHHVPRAVKKIKCGGKKVKFNTENGILRFEQSLSKTKNNLRIVLKR